MEVPIFINPIRGIELVEQHLEHAFPVITRNFGDLARVLPTNVHNGLACSPGEREGYRRAGADQQTGREKMKWGHVTSATLHQQQIPNILRGTDQVCRAGGEKAMIINHERVLRFVAVAEQLSFTKAAETLRIDQPWLSRQIMQLEEQLGFPLIDRTSSRIALTQKGSEFLIAARELARASEVVREKAETMHRLASSVLRIGTSYAASPVEWRKRLLGQFLEIKPNVELDYSVYKRSDEVVGLVISGEIDFGIVLGPTIDRNIKSCTLKVPEVKIAIPSEDPLAERTSLALADLKGRYVAVGMTDRTVPGYARSYSWIDEVGAIPVFVPEGRRFIFEVAEKERLCVLCYLAADQPPLSFVERKILPPVPHFEIQFVRGDRAMSSTCERLWRLANEFGEVQHAAVA